MSEIKYTGLEPYIPLRFHAKSVADKMELLVPNLNYTHQHLFRPKDSAKELTGKQIVDNATDSQIAYMRKIGVIA